MWDSTPLTIFDLHSLGTPKEFYNSRTKHNINMKLNTDQLLVMSCMEARDCKTWETKLTDILTYPHSTQDIIRTCTKGCRTFHVIFTSYYFRKENFHRTSLCQRHTIISSSLQCKTINRKIMGTIMQMHVTVTSCSAWAEHLEISTHEYTDEC